MADEARYVLAKKIARGGMAEIYLGKQVGEDGFQRLCAIKRILPHYAADQEFIQMFRDEAHICKRLQHANIVRVEGFEEVDGSFAIIMEYVDGADLRTLLHSVEQAKKRMPVPMACYIIAEAARGLHFAHTKVDEITQQPLGIVHRDISPQNILVSFEGECKVTDFGIADAESKLTETRPGIVKGKYSYMSPEQISAKPVDARTDVFALSIALWEMLAMRRLFQGENEVDTIQRVKNCRIDFDLRQLNPEVDEELDQIVKKALAKDPKKRYKSAYDFEKDLRRHMSKKFSDFSPTDLGEFLKKNMEARRTESAAEIKKTLTETNLKPSTKKTGSTNADKAKSVDLALDDASGPAISIARPTGLSTGIRQLGSNATGASQAGTRGGTNTTGLSGRSGGKSPNASTVGSSIGLTVGHHRGHNSSKIWMLGSMAAVALALALAVWSWPSKQAHAFLQLRTQPSRVKVLIDNKPINQGRYIFTPPKDDRRKRKPPTIRLKPGTHKLTVYRSGYQTYRTEIELEPGDTFLKDDVILKETQPLAAVKIFGKATEAKALRVDINNGYFVSTLTPGTYINPDLFPGKLYSMTVTPQGEKAFTCKLRPKSTNWRQPNEVTIDRKARKCTMSGS
jgi:serine/threonine protein kinase